MEWVKQVLSFDGHENTFSMMVTFVDTVTKALRRMKWRESESQCAYQNQVPIHCITNMKCTHDMTECVYVSNSGESVCKKQAKCPSGAYIFECMAL